jgi:hypothetical protein
VVGVFDTKIPLRLETVRTRACRSGPAAPAPLITRGGEQWRYGYNECSRDEPMFPVSVGARYIICDFRHQVAMRTPENRVVITEPYCSNIVLSVCRTVLMNTQHQETNTITHPHTRNYAH